LNDFGQFSARGGGAIALPTPLVPEALMLHLIAKFT